ncbi:Flagellar hook-associated protein FlgK [Acidisarcina polymorpha]|uniref:Flagellar hook-associated protein 1 n=1 Tax=Acidisarcina polymorpha TaxID=2211140 RepID=A0A2Z5FV87_9BACT|nr:flagellar hook-associated protein FlgK [Acidisarcina polymorpha]AXC10414.1 Flagellar hook-associated protein FlgK [Acidisarcina polymorpha]
MATLNSAWNIAVSSLNADQAALNASANNTANVNTPGYTRKEAIFDENIPVTIAGLTYGTGASVIDIQSQRDRVLEQSVDQQTQTQQATATRLAALQNVQAVFAAATSTTAGAANGGINSSLSQFFAALTPLEGNPSDTSLRETVLSAAVSLVESFSGSITELQQQQASLDAESQSVVTQVNALSKSIAGLNQQIQTLDPTSDAGGLEDQRQYDLNQLSQLVGISQIKTENNGLTVTTTSGALLVSEGTAFALTSGPSAGVTHYFDAQGNDITTPLASGGGQLGGYLTTRDQDIPHVEGALDALAGGLANRLNAIQQSGSTASGASAAGYPLFTVPASGGSPGSIAGGITVAISDPTLVAAGTAGKGPSDGSNAVLLANVQTSPQTFAAQPGSPYQVTAPVSPTNYFADFIATLGSLVSQTSSLSTAQQASLAQTQTQRDSLSAVNTNDEASTLSLLERSYEASSKVFTILDTVFASALNLGEQTTVA